MTSKPETGAAQPPKPRDLRLDFFRGLAMFIILLAHTPDNTWTLWIPARFGFSDATEIFVFCSGMASALAFGTVYAKRSWRLGTARILYRIWQVYWSHIGIVLIVAAMMVALQNTGMGEPGKDYTQWFPIGGFFSETPGRPGETLLGLFTLTYVPGLFDILPMYLVILALVPVVMAVHRAGGKEAVFAFVLILWAAANLAGYARKAPDPGEMTALQALLVGIGSHVSFLNFPAVPWEPAATWFFNPFGWQLVFFTGFAFAMGWIPAPPIRRWLVILSLAVVLVTLPLAWHKTYQYLTGYLPQHLGGGFLWDANEAIEPVRWKTWVGAWRYVHFLAVAYLAWAAVGAGGIRLSTGWTAPVRPRLTRQVIGWLCLPFLLVTAPYTYIDEIRYLAPALDRQIAGAIAVEARYLGMFQIVHLIAFVTLAWQAVGDRWRQWLIRDAFLATVPVIRKVGTQSLAVFLVSLAVARFNGWWKDAMGAAVEGHGYFTAHDVWMVWLVNLTGFAVLIATAYIVGWFRRQPWRDRAGRKDPVATSAPVRTLAAE